MPTRNEIQQEILRRKAIAQDDVRRRYVRELSEYTNRDTILYAADFTSSKSPAVPATIFSVSFDDIQGFMSALHGLKSNTLDLILHSPGGAMEAADQIVQYLRTKYQEIRAIVPQNAMSAATMIACACDSIVMGKHSAIGPIDPQVTFPTATGTFTSPAQAILDEFARAKQEITDDPTTIPLWASKVQTYPHGFLDLCETTLRLAKDKVSEWLESYMFRDDPEGADKSRQIAEWLSDATEHKTHARPITIAQVLEKRLTVERLEDDQEFQEKVLSVFHATMATFQVTNCVKIVENQNGKGVYTQVQLQAIPVPHAGTPV